MKMKRLLGINKTFHVLMIVMFFLPFMTVRCLGPSAEEIESYRIADSTNYVDSLKQLDSIAISDLMKFKIKSKHDSLKMTGVDSNLTHNDISKLDTMVMHQNIMDDDANFSGVFSRIVKIVGFTIVDNYSNYTGLGMVYLSVYPLRCFTGFLNAFILIMLSCFTVFNIKWRDYKRILIYDIIGFTFLSITINNDLLWGFWMCFFSWIGLIFFDILILIKGEKYSANQIDCPGGIPGTGSLSRH